MKIRLMAASVCIALAGGSQAAVTPEEAKQLGTTLTFWGATKEGNADKSIPEYSGGLPATTAPAGFKKDSGYWPDPFADDKPLFRINAKNLDQYGSKLTEATKALIKRFPDSFYVNVYPTRRSVSYSEAFKKHTLENVGRCQTTDGGLAVKGCFGGVPFPIPKTGHEMMWNVILSNKPAAYFMKSEGMYADSNGNPVQAARNEVYLDCSYCDQKSSLQQFEANGQTYNRFNVINIEPARLAGSGQTMSFTANPVRFKNLGWQYQPGQRRTRVIPEPGYDFPVIATGGVMFFDEVNMFTGQLDRYDFKLVGKQELYIPYNTQRTIFTTKEKMAGGRHPNPEPIRWELHRVWVVDAVLKDGARHAAPKRRYYIDEDHHGSGVTDSWDRAGKPYKLGLQLPYIAYDKQVAIALSMLVYDFSTGSYASNTYFPSPGDGMVMSELHPPAMFTPEGLARRSAR